MNAVIKKDKRLKEQFINGVNDDNMMTGVIWELTKMKRPMQSHASKHYAGPKELKHKEPRQQYKK